MEFITISISVLALAISATTLWLTYLHRGRLEMTHPTVVFFGYDYVPTTTPKIFIRTLLYSTSARGIVIESMHIKLSREGSEQVFGFWGYGEAEKLMVGSGLYVGRAGVGANHHFVLSVHCAEYSFLPGEYTIDIYARTVGSSSASKLKRIKLTLSAEQAELLSRHEGILFERDPDGHNYVGHANYKRLADDGLIPERRV